VDHFVLVRLDMFEYVFTFQVLDSEEGRVEWDSDLVEDWCERGRRPIPEKHLLYDTKRRFESDAFRSITCADCVALQGQSCANKEVKRTYTVV